MAKDDRELLEQILHEMTDIPIARIRAWDDEEIIVRLTGGK